MQERLFGESFMFGSQYYRAPSPPRSDWARDLGRMAELGFNTVKFWAQWRWNHPDIDRFYWDDIDGLMDEAERQNLKVMLNTIVDVAPSWIYRRYPDASMVTLDGRKIGPQTQPHRQIGGLGVCLNHTEVMEHMFGFLRACVERYREHPALHIWNVGSEPELTQSMSEMRLYADDHRKMGDMLCYCPRCEYRFRHWLKEKYGEIGTLNELWNRNYRDFEDVELPKTRNTFNDMINWRMFFVDVLGENVRRRFEVARSVDEGRHPLMCHHVFIQGFPLTSTANDPWNVGQLGDLHGFTQMDDPMMHDILRSCARGKPVISAEMLMLMGYTLDLHKEIDESDVKRHIFTGVAANLKGFVFWQYRPELLGREAPAWGLTQLDGSSTPWLEAFGSVGRALQKHSSFIHEARPKNAEVAILYSPENQIFTWTATGNEKNATDSLLGFHRALYERNHVIDFVHVKEVRSEIIDRYKVIVLPFPYCLPEAVCAELKQWVKRGGTLIAEAYLAGWYLEGGRHSTIVPGNGLAEVFGVRQENAVPPDVRDDTLIPLNTAEILGDLPVGHQAFGCMVREHLSLHGANVLARFTNGNPAITACKFGGGTAVSIASFLALPYARAKATGNGLLLASLIDHTTQIRRPTVSTGDRIRVDVLYGKDDRKMISVQNLEDSPVSCKVTLPDIELSEWHELFSGETPAAQVRNGSVTMPLALAGREVKVFLGA